MGLKLGLNLGYWGIGPQGDEATEIVLAAERFGFDSVWSAESYGSDAVSVLAYMAAKTETIQLGAAILQVPARQPAASARPARRSQRAGTECPTRSRGGGPASTSRSSSGSSPARTASPMRGSTS